MLKYPFYVRNITNLSDARYCAGMGVELLGFNFDSLENLTQFETIKGWVSGVKFVAEFENTTLEHILNVIDIVKPDFILLNSLNLDWQDSIKIPVIFKISFENSFAHYPKLGSLVLLNSFNTNKKLSDNTVQIKEFNFDYQYKIFLGYGFVKENIHEIFDKYQPFGFSLIGEKEISPGLKNFDHLSEIFEEIEV